MAVILVNPGVVQHIGNPPAISMRSRESVTGGRRKPPFFLVRARIGHIMAAMQRQIALAALLGMAALIFAPELMDAGTFVLAKSLDVNALKVIQNSLYGLGCF
jgi:hypothetical protein